MPFGIKVAGASVVLVNAGTAPSVQVRIRDIGICVGAQHMQLNANGVRRASNSLPQPVPIPPHVGHHRLVPTSHSPNIPRGNPCRIVILNGVRGVRAQ